MTTATVRLSVADAAARLGISTDTVRRKLKRGQLQAKRDNHGQWWVEIPAYARETTERERQAAEIARLDGLLTAERARVDELLKRRSWWPWRRSA